MKCNFSYHDELFMDAPKSEATFTETFEKPFQASSSDVFIALMGMTGAGKSTFISHCTEEEVRISEPGALESCTQEVRVHRCKQFSPGANVYLVDTPGFDDTNRKDTDILKEIASWLTETYQQKIKLRGILYLHRISDNRMGGCAHKNLVMFKRLCGHEGIKNVTFVTTHWEKVDEAEGEKRESTLKSTKEFWGFFVEKGATVRRHWNNKDSSLYIVEQFVPGWGANPPDKVNLAIQTEMVDYGKDLNNTSAGQELQETIEKEREKMRQEMKARDEEMREALKARDKEMFEFLRQEQENQRAELKRRSKEMDELKISMESMHTERVERLEAHLKQQHQKHIEYRQSVERRDERRERERIAEIERIQAKHDTERKRQQDMLQDLESQIKELRRRSPQPQASNSSFKNPFSHLLGQTTTRPRQPRYHQGQPTQYGSQERLFDEYPVTGRSYPRPPRNHSAGYNSGRHDSGRRSDQGQDNFTKYRHNPRLTCLTCGEHFSSRNDLFSHILALQHGRNIQNGRPEKVRLKNGTIAAKMLPE